MSKLTPASAAPAAVVTTVETPTGTLGDIKAIVDTTEAAPDMPAIGEKVLLEAVFGRLVNPMKPAAADELDQGKITKAEFDDWHAVQWKAGKIRRAAI